MSEKNFNNNQTQPKTSQAHENPETPAVIAGVIKFNHRKYGYPQVKELAEKWAKVERFKTVIIRKVSPVDYGIQFVFVSNENDGEKALKPFMKEYIYPLKEYTFAWDVAGITDPTEDLLKYEPLNI